MPELPDVEIQKEYLDATALHKRIAKTQILSRDLLKETTPRKLRTALKGHEFKSSRRHGKYLFARVSSEGKWVVFHFGMTGFLKYFRQEDEKPEYTRILFSFTNEYHLAYVAQRKLGLIQLINDMEGFIEKHKLGPDALDPGFTFKQFRESLGDGRAMVKSALMNQKALAGVGNIYSDEILYQAGIDPRRRTGDLSGEEQKRLYRQMHRVLKTAIDKRADPSGFPRSFIIPHRRGDNKCPGGGELKSLKVSGRTSFYCPGRQK